MTIEAFNMVSSFSVGRQFKKIIDEAEGWLIEKHGLSIFRGNPTGTIPPDLLEEYRQVNKMQCPFMQADKRCLIYQERPLTCRAFGVYRDNAGIGCPRPPGKGETITQHCVVNGEEVRQVLRGWQGELRSKNPSWTVRAFVPAVLFKVAQPEKFKVYLDANQIASAKLVATNTDTSIMFQSQLNALRQGVSPDRVVMREMVNSS